MLREKNKKGKYRVLRYYKLQSTVGVEDPARIPQAILIRHGNIYVFFYYLLKIKQLIFVHSTTCHHY